MSRLVRTVCLVAMGVLAGAAWAGGGCGACGGCPGASASACSQQAPLPASVKLVTLDDDTVDLVKELGTGPKVMFTFKPDSAGNEVAVALQRAWSENGDSSVSLLGVVCGTREQAEASRKEFKLGFPLILDQGCAGSMVLGLTYCPGAVFVRKDGTVAGRAYVFSEEVVNHGFAAMSAAALQVDPVCGMQVTADETVPSFAYRGKTYYFCSTGCRAAFEKNPAKYLRS